MATLYVICSPNQEMYFLPQRGENNIENGSWRTAYSQIEEIPLEDLRDLEIAQSMLEDLRNNYDYPMELESIEVDKEDLCSTCRFYNPTNNGICGENRDMSIYQYDCLSYFMKNTTDKYISINSVKECKRWTDEQDKKIKELMADKAQIIEQVRQIDREIKELTGLDYDEQEQYHYWIDLDGSRIEYEELTDINLVTIFQELAKKKEEVEVTVRWFKIKEEVLMRWGISYIGEDKITLNEMIKKSIDKPSVLNDLCSLLIDKVKKDSSDEIIEEIKREALKTASQIENDVKERCRSWESHWNKKKKEIDKLHNELKENLITWYQDKLYISIQAVFDTLNINLSALSKEQQKDLYPLKENISEIFNELKLKEVIGERVFFIVKEIVEQIEIILKEEGYDLTLNDKEYLKGDLVSLIKDIKRRKTEEIRKETLLMINAMESTKETRKTARSIKAENLQKEREKSFNKTGRNLNW